MQASLDAATAALETAAEALLAVLGPATGDHTPTISPTQLRVLRWLQANPTTNVNGLAEALGVSASSASRLCDRLEAQGLLRRESDARDRREVRIVVTSAALTLLAKLDRLRRAALERVLAAMPVTARRELARSLSAFSAAAAKLASAEGGRRTA